MTQKDNQENEQKEIRQLSEKTDHDLLVELVRQQQKNARTSRIAMIFLGCILAVLVVFFAMTVPKTVSTFKEIQNGMKKLQDFTAKAEEEMEELDKLAKQAEGSLSNLDALSESAAGSLDGIDEMVSNINQLVVDNTEALDETISKMNQVDFDKLNQAIEDLSNVVAPLAALFGGR